MILVFLYLKIQIVILWVMHIQLFKVLSSIIFWIPNHIYMYYISGGSLTKIVEQCAIKNKV